MDSIAHVISTSRIMAQEDLVEDAIIQLTALQGQPNVRLRMCALIGIDDLQSHTDNEGERERLGILKTALETGIYSKVPLDRDQIYEAALEYIEDAPAEQLPVYTILLPIHQEMAAEEEAALEEEMRGIREAIEAAEVAEAMAVPVVEPAPVSVAPVSVAPVSVAQLTQEEMRAARLRSFEKRVTGGN
jgi:hypothetical protein